MSRIYFNPAVMALVFLAGIFSAVSCEVMEKESSQATREKLSSYASSLIMSYVTEPVSMVITLQSVDAYLLLDEEQRKESPMYGLIYQKGPSSFHIEGLGSLETGAKGFSVPGTEWKVSGIYTDYYGSSSYSYSVTCVAENRWKLSVYDNEGRKQADAEVCKSDVIQDDSCYYDTEVSGECPDGEYRTVFGTRSGAFRQAYKKGDNAPCLLSGTFYMEIYRGNEMTDWCTVVKDGFITTFRTSRD